MSELIKENMTESLITMARLRFSTLLGLVLLIALILSALQNGSASNSTFVLSLADTRPPNVYAWGIEGEPELGSGFDVWANVTDDESGLRNVTIQVTGPNMTLNNLMTFNGTFYTGSVPAFPNDGTFIAQIRAYDMANNTRTSAHIEIVFESDPLPTIDPSVTMPVVVGSSIGLMALVVVLAMVFEKRRNLGGMVDSSEIGE